ncbi:MAG: hypothetical protein V7704_03470 [Aurantimonas endophytica]|uniref:Endonuclease YncB(Thermonuclease family) n=1 Tax=Aurantimonas endophytica TaxID=1522175 RepID=A0A7W6MRD6_9HYPH|nr:thermonuclease family protein [Aurantimonas endophytica]MBB4004863.1 hypothetical protein [Aurantimonas endophytica]MCO6405673.1 hypothetical protein [Aurantimonas endophytica]
MSLGDRLQRDAGIAAGLVGLAAVFLLLAPSPDAPGPQEVPASAEAEPEVTPEDPLVVRPARNVAPPAITQRGDLDQTPLRRVQPPPAAAEPESNTEEEAATYAPSDIRLLAQPVAIDAGRIAIGESFVTLPGLAAPDLARRCGSGADEWPCGIRARTELRAYLRGRSIRCAVPDDFGEAEETVATACSLGGSDIGEWLVRNGWAEAAVGGPYVDAETEAKRERRGLWR